MLKLKYDLHIHIIIMIQKLNGIQYLELIEVKWQKCARKEFPAFKAGQENFAQEGNAYYRRRGISFETQCSAAGALFFPCLTAAQERPRVSSSCDFCARFSTEEN